MTFTRLALGLAIIGAAVLDGQSLGAGAANQSQAPDMSDSVAIGTNLGFEPVGPGDLLSITVAGAPELSRSVRVSAAGKLTLPLLKNEIVVDGMTPAAVARAVASELVKEKLIVEPIVSAAVLEYRTKRVSVVGAVRMPATFQAVGEMRLLDALARAQGFAPEAGPEIIVSFPANGHREQPPPMRIERRALLEGKDPAQNIVLRGGEEIQVPEAPKLFITGNVKQPGVYPLSDPEGSSVLKALALSQGTMSFTAKQAFIYRLVGDSGKREEIPVELRAIMRRKAPDVALCANDILYVPDKPKTRLTAATLQSLSGLGSSVATGLIVWH